MPAHEVVVHGPLGELARFTFSPSDSPELAAERLKLIALLVRPTSPSTDPRRKSSRADRAAGEPSVREVPTSDTEAEE